MRTELINKHIRDPGTNKFIIELPYYIGDYVKTYDTGRFVYRGQVIGYTIINDGIIIYVSEHKTHKTYGFLPSEIEFDYDYDEVIKKNGNSDEFTSEKCD